MVKTLTSLSLRFTHVWWRDDEDVDGKRCHRANGENTNKSIPLIYACMMKRWWRCRWKKGPSSSMASSSIYFVIISSSYMRCVDRRDRLVCVFASCSMVPFSIYFVIICSSVSECVCVLQQDSSLRDLRGLKRAQGGQNLDSQVRMRKPAREAGCVAFFADWGLALG